MARNLDAGAQLVERAASHQAPILDNANMGAEAFHHFKNVGGQENRSAMCDKPLQEPFESSGGNGVHPFKWLVEEQILRSLNLGRRNWWYLCLSMGCV